MKPIEEQTIGVWVGLDWADQEHAYALRMSGSSEIETGGRQTKHRRPCRSWINGLRERSGGGWVAIAVEQSRGALLYALMDYDFCVDLPDQPEVLEPLPWSLLSQWRQRRPEGCGSGAGLPAQASGTDSIVGTRIAGGALPAPCCPSNGASWSICART